MATRQEVYAAIDGEREYQDVRWTQATTRTDGKHESVTEWLVYMQDYVQEALHFLSRNGEPQATTFAKHSVRKVAALGVACLEQLGPIQREGHEIMPQPVVAVKYFEADRLTLADGRVFVEIESPSPSRRMPEQV